MKHAIPLAIALVFAVATDLAAQPGMPQRILDCAAVDSAVQRLDCYDNAVRNGRSVSPRPAAVAVPQFRDFPARAGPPARNAPVLLSTDQELTFRTRLREAATRRPDFAGFYVVAIWGCGTDCLMGAAVNTRTGRVAFLPASICCLTAGDGYTDKIAYRADSTLLVLTGRRNEAEDDLGAHFYRIQGDQFVHVSDVPLTSKP